MKKIIVSVLLSGAVSAACFSQKFDSVAQTPPMGWNSWNRFGTDISEKLVREIADAMVESGMKDAGYAYIVIDDGWQMSRDADGNIVMNHERFPNGIKPVADYVHSKGLKFGIYSDAGRKTCQGLPGSRGYEYQDARAYASWGVDYLKYDWCYHGTQNSEASYTLMRDALYAAGRPMVFSICEWGTTRPWLWAGDVGHLWRTTEDIQDCWDCVNEWGGLGWVKILDKQAGLEQYAGPGHWNDPDMLEVGNGGMTATEYKCHFSMWCMLAAPLMAGNDIRSMSHETREILTNKEAISVNQDKLGKQARRIVQSDGYQMWVKELSGNEIAVAFFNGGDSSITTNVSWPYILRKFGLKKKSYTLRDLWKHENIGTTDTPLQVRIKPHDILMVRLVNN